MAKSLNAPTVKTNIKIKTMMVALACSLAGAPVDSVQAHVMSGDRMDKIGVIEPVIEEHLPQMDVENHQGIVDWKNLFTPTSNYDIDSEKIEMAMEAVDAVLLQQIQAIKSFPNDMILDLQSDVNGANKTVNGEYYIGLAHLINSDQLYCRRYEVAVTEKNKAGTAGDDVYWATHDVCFQEEAMVNRKIETGLDLNK